MNVAVSVKNSTVYTPTLSAVTVTGAQWVDHLALAVGQSIPPDGQVAGLLDADVPFTGTVVVRFGFVAPGPAGADVTLTFRGTELDGRPLFSYDWQVSTVGAFPGTDVLVGVEGNDRTLLLLIAD
ncbi:hypothetical protein ACFUMH_12670 [Cellulomonas sp. NPDC057328]|uniref:hypothetical protein n=1 Tax=Cellulomonas sp. NPDC057328 TaxID=3346101 RepID=UPI00362CC504